MKKIQLIFVGLPVALFFLLPSAARAQQHDYMTEQESDIVREAQEIDQRINVLTKMIDRRFLALNGGEDKKLQKESGVLGDLPPETRPELLFDINRLLQKSIDDIDNVAQNGAMNSKIFPKAVKKLTESSQKYLPLLQAALDKAENEKDKGIILSAIDNCNDIIAASQKLPKDAPKN